MIDTISITVEKSGYFFNKDIQLRTTMVKGFVKRIYNPSKIQIRKFGYLPRVTEFEAVRQGGYSTFLKIEFSIPKLLYGNNFDEVEESDFSDICWKLKESLLNMGIGIPNIKEICNSQVSTIHYSKNIVLTDYSTPYTILKEVSKVNVSKMLDFSQTDFRNEGHSVKFHSNDYEIIFYDKLKDLEQSRKSEKRAIEKDNYIQMGLFDVHKPKKPFEVLRMEARLGSRKRIKGFLKKTGLDNKELTFAELFSKDVSQKILLYIYKDIEMHYPKILGIEETTIENILIEIQINNPTLNYHRMLAVIGAKQLFDELGIRKFRELSKKFDKRNFPRLMKDLNMIKVNKFKSPFELINNSLTSFSKVRLEDYKDKM